MLQKTLLENGNSKDYYVIESTLKGNYLLKSNWRKDLQEGIPNYLAGSGIANPGLETNSRHNTDFGSRMDNLQSMAKIKMDPST